MRKSKIGYFILGSAIIWAAIIIGCSLKLHGTNCYNEISLILSGGFIGHLVLIWGPVVGFIKKIQNA
ncbi:MAG: hypothetical protein C0597_00955 [Marinilabiliales bacterium]|nr:MAG: hypothetical protein C0597_00955 [Marinilabiliales bacterium]